MIKYKTIRTLLIILNTKYCTSVEMRRNRSVAMYDNMEQKLEEMEPTQMNYSAVRPLLLNKMNGMLFEIREIIERNSRYKSSWLDITL